MFWAVVGCYQPELSASAPDAVTSSDPADAGLDEESDAGGAEEVDAREVAQTLSFRVQTFPVGGRFAPNNIGAIWIEDEAGSFIKTLALWGRIRAQYLRNFQAASKGHLVDVVASATLPRHESHDVSWDMRDLKGEIIADGTYRVLMELTDKNSTGAKAEVPFVKNREAALIEPADTPQFRAIELRIE